MNADPPPDPPRDAARDPEALLRGLAFPSLPPDWRAGILAAAAAVPPLPPWWRRPYFVGMAAAWSAIGLLKLTTPDLPPPPPPPPPGQRALPPGLPPSFDNAGAPWLAGRSSDPFNTYPEFSR